MSRDFGSVRYSVDDLRRTKFRDNKMSTKDLREMVLAAARKIERWPGDNSQKDIHYCDDRELWYATIAACEVIRRLGGSSYYPGRAACAPLSRFRKQSITIFALFRAYDGRCSPWTDSTEILFFAVNELLSDALARVRVGGQSDDS